jgi:transcriptional regulator with XRE-family HTH domain
MQNAFMDTQTVRCENARMPQVSYPPGYLDEVAARVRLFRSVVASSQKELCDRIGISTNAWNHYEKGRSPPSQPVCAKLKRLHGVTRDWFMDGSLAGMPIDLVAKLDKATPPETRVNKRRA